MYYGEQVPVSIQVSAVVSSGLMPESSPRTIDSKCRLIQVHTGKWAMSALTSEEVIRNR
jgi:hypothetical protein